MRKLCAFDDADEPFSNHEGDDGGDVILPHVEEGLAIVVSVRLLEELLVVVMVKLVMVMRMLAVGMGRLVVCEVPITVVLPFGV